MATPDEITRHHEPDPAEDPWVHGRPPPRPITIVESDARWPALYVAVEERVRAALGGAALALQHVGSTAVPGLPAKPILDVDLTVADPADEAAYVPALEASGFRLTIREPSWHHHRLLKGADPDTNLHVWGPGCPEAIRHLMFRDWLRAHPEDVAAYADAKRAAAAEITALGQDVEAYNRHKEPVIRAIYERMFRAAGLL